MHRWIARLLLLLTLVGYVGPLARAATAAPPHACCIRKAVHHCHDSLSAGTDELVVRDTGCCNNRCGRSVITVRWAHAHPATSSSFARTVENYLTPDDPIFANTKESRFLSTRAPPHSPIA